MKIYFAASIRGGREDQQVYFDMISELSKYGEVLTEHIGNASLMTDGENRTDEYIFSRDMEYVTVCDVVVAEVSTASLGVGYELGRAEAMGKKIICLYRRKEGKKLSAMIAGNSYVAIYEYLTLDEVRDIFKKEFQK